MSENVKLYNQIATADDLAEFSSAELVEALRYWDDAYFNDDELISDARYDAIKKYLAISDPNNDYLHGVGSDVRGGKVDLIHPMGSLNQFDTDEEIQKWLDKYDLRNNTFIATRKKDGYSTSTFYNNSGKIRIGFSRGNGFQGADITRHLTRMKLKLPQEIVAPNLEIRAEAIISRANFETLRQMGVKTSAGKPYKNPRNMVSGLMNSSEIAQNVIKYIDIIVYHVWNDTHHETKEEQLLWLQDMGFTIPHYEILKASDLRAEVLVPLLNKHREDSEYDIDGLVIEVNETAKREEIAPTRAHVLNPEHSFKYKIASEDNVAYPTVKKVVWNISKHNYAKPTVTFDGVELCGVTVQKATGFNAAFIIENGIAPGAKIKITRSGDVIPFILGVVEPNHNFDHESDIQEQFGAFHWTDTHVDIVIDQSTEEAEIGKAVDFFTKLGVEKLKEGNVRLLFGCGFNSTAKIINASQEDMNFAVGADAATIYKSLHKILGGISLPLLMGASSLLGRGIGVRKVQKLYDVLGDKILHANAADIAEAEQKVLGNLSAEDVQQVDEDAETLSTDDIRWVQGYGSKTAAKFVENLPKFLEFYNEIKDKVTIVQPKVVVGGKLSGETVVFTGFRNKQLEKRFEEAGAKIASSFTKSVTILIAADPEENSTKLQKARQQGTRIVGLADVEDLF